VAYVNDYLEHEDMPAASAGLIMLNGIGAMGAPIAVGYLMDTTVDNAFFLFLSACFASMTLYSLWRMLQSPVRVVVGEQGPLVPMSQVVSPIAADVALEAAIEQEIEQEKEAGSDGEDGESREAETVDG